MSRLSEISWRTQDSTWVTRTKRLIVYFAITWFDNSKFSMPFWSEITFRDHRLTKRYLRENYLSSTKTIHSSAYNIHANVE